MIKNIFFGSLLVTALATPVAAAPPADLDGCLKLTGEVTKGAAAKIKTEAEYVKFHFKQLDLVSACGQRNFVEAEKIAKDIKATFRLD